MVDFNRENWAEESAPLQKSKIPVGKDLSSAECPKCKRRVKVVDGKMAPHNCVDIK